MTRGKYLILGTLILFSCGVKKPLRISDKDNYADSIATEWWLDFDVKKQSSFVDIHKFGRLIIPGKWYYYGGQSYGKYEYQNEEKDILHVELGVPDTMNFYIKGMTNKEFINKLYEQALTFWKEKEDLQIETVEENIDNVIGKVTSGPKNKMYFLFGLRDNHSMTLYFVPSNPDGDGELELMRNVYIE